MKNLGRVGGGGGGGNKVRYMRNMEVVFTYLMFFLNESIFFSVTSKVLNDFLVRSVG